MRTDGFEIGFHSALSEPIMIGGAPRTIALLNGTLTAVVALGLQQPWIGLPMGVVVHALAYWLSRKDPYVFDVLRRHLRQPSYLDA